MKIFSALSSLGAILCISACSGSDPAPGKDTAKFAGTWQFTAGTSTTQCEGQPADTEPLTGQNIRVDKGVDSDLAMVTDTCTLKLDVNGDNASARTGQTCKETVEGITVTQTITALNLTVTGTTARISGSMDATATFGGQIINCDVTLSGDLNKVTGY